jgi:Tol biopolymer transport system component
MIAFWSDRGGDHEIWAMRLDGSGLVNVSDFPGADENPSWSR